MGGVGWVRLLPSVTRPAKPGVAKRGRHTAGLEPHGSQREAGQRYGDMRDNGGVECVVGGGGA